MTSKSYSAAPTNETLKRDNSSLTQYNSYNYYCPSEVIWIDGTLEEIADCVKPISSFSLL